VVRYYPPSKKNTLELAAQETWNWCKHFVVNYGLCPWAAASTQTQGAVEMHLVAPLDDTDEMLNAFEKTIQVVTKDFCASLEVKDPNTAISFVVLVDLELDFELFYEWFVDLEDAWLENEDYESVTLAAFHPDWSFASNDEESSLLSLEKKTPYPTVSIVSAAVIDKAGPVATKQIGEHNADVLLDGKTLDQWQALYDQAIHRPNDNIERHDVER
jgi:hypothetical protein